LTTENKLPVAASYYGSIGWKVMPTHGLLPNNMCTCGKTHTDPKDIGKHPASAHGQDDSTSDGATIHGWWSTNPLYNIAVHCEPTGFFVLDVDPRNGGFEAFDKLEEALGGEFFEEGTAATTEAITGEYSLRGAKVRGKHLYFQAPAGSALQGKLKDFPGIDIKHKGYTLIAPSRHVSGVNYQWAPGRAPWETPVAKPSAVLLDLISKGIARGSANSSSGRGAVGRSSWDWINDLDWKGEKLDLQKFMEEGIDEGSRAIDLYAITCAMANKYGTTDMDRKFIETQMIAFNHEMVRPPLPLEGQGGLMTHVHNAINFVAANPKNPAPATKSFIDPMQKKVESWVSNMGKTSIATTPSAGAIEQVFTGDPDDIEEYIQPDILTNVNIALDVDALSEDDGGQMGGRTLSDLGNGRRLVDAFGGTIRYTPGLGWFKWNAQYWKPDTEDLELRELTKRMGSLIAAESEHFEDPDQRKLVNNWAKMAKSNARQSAAIESAQSDPRISVDVDHWDNNPYLLGVANGVVDLRTGELLRGRQDLHITRRAPVNYSPNYSSPRFQKFLDDATGGDKEYQEWLQRAFGYTLTGRRDYDVMFVMYGPAGSGKNVMVESLVKVLGTKQYAFPLDSQILAQGDGKSNAADLYHWAELRGRRMIWVDELPESERLKENAVKKLTGSSEISARSPGEKPFTFESQGKLWITTNHRPIITDDAMWRRIRPIPWMNVPTQPDPTLKAYLHDPEGGLPAVLAWAVEGAMKLHASKEVDALGWCKVVADAAEMYRKNEDRLGLFLEDETEETTVSSVSLKSLYAVYNSWSEDRGERPMTQIALQRKMSDRGIQINGSGGRAMVMGRVLKNAGSLPAGGTIDWGFQSRMARD
jgi:putative DNA primase/helicase